MNRLLHVDQQGKKIMARPKKKNNSPGDFKNADYKAAQDALIEGIENIELDDEGKCLLEELILSAKQLEDDGTEFMPLGSYLGAGFGE